ncbi:MAG: folylpolyglutamate synthase/dihydrofolate synthase family protein [Verrucomicrobiota bacterium]
MTYSDAIQFLYDLSLFGATFGLDKTRRLAGRVGNPQDRLRFIHVAGTNGKGSTCAMLESIYRAAGHRTGLFTSPHLVSFAERIQVNRQPIPESEVVRLVEEIRPLLAEFPEGQGPTFFETATILALRYFAEQGCDLVIWETGLGGRLDATNIVTPLVSVITNIDIEHSQWLGDTVEKIASEKAGIIKPGIPVVTAALPGKGLEVIEATARERGSRCIRVGSANLQPPLDEIDLPLHGPHQRVNAATAVAAVRALTGVLPVPDSAIRDGLAHVEWAGRMQCIRTASGQNILLDAAHNPAGAEALRDAMQTEYPGRRPTLIFGVFKDKDAAAMCRLLAPLAGRMILTSVHSDRSEDPARLVNLCREINPGLEVSISDSLAGALESAGGDSFVAVAGSLYLIGEALELLQAAPPRARDEKALNQWHPPAARGDK